MAVPLPPIKATSIFSYQDCDMCITITLTKNSENCNVVFLQKPDLMSKLLGPLKDRFMTRPGGYTRVLRAPKRKGDNAPMAVIELIGNRWVTVRLTLPLAGYDLARCRNYLLYCSL